MEVIKAIRAGERQPPGCWNCVTSTSKRSSRSGGWSPCTESGRRRLWLLGGRHCRLGSFIRNSGPSATGKAGRFFCAGARRRVQSRDKGLGGFVRRLRRRKGGLVATKALARKLAGLYCRGRRYGLEDAERGRREDAQKHEESQPRRLGKLAAQHGFKRGSKPSPAMQPSVWSPQPMSRPPETLPDARAAPRAGTQINPVRFMGRMAGPGSDSVATLSRCVLGAWRLGVEFRLPRRGAMARSQRWHRSAPAPGRRRGVERFAP